LPRTNLRRTLQLPVRFRKPNPIFARGELRRVALDMLREGTAARLGV
jgi:hypothetical protein